MLICCAVTDDENSQAAIRYAFKLVSLMKTPPSSVKLQLIFVDDSQPLIQANGSTLSLTTSGNKSIKDAEDAQGKPASSSLFSSATPVQEFSANAAKSAAETVRNLPILDRLEHQIYPLEQHELNKQQLRNIVAFLRDEQGKWPGVDYELKQIRIKPLTTESNRSHDKSLFSGGGVDGDEVGNHEDIEEDEDEGSVEEILVEYARDKRADLFIIGTHEYSRLKKWLIGSVSEYCLQHMPCPVLIVKREHAQ